MFCSVIVISSSQEHLRMACQLLLIFFVAVICFCSGVSESVPRNANLNRKHQSGVHILNLPPPQTYSSLTPDEIKAGLHLDALDGSRRGWVELGMKLSRGERITVGALGTYKVKLIIVKIKGFSCVPQDPVIYA